MLALALSCAAVMTLSGLPDDAPPAVAPPASPAAADAPVGPAGAAPEASALPPAASLAGLSLVDELPPDRMPYLGGPVPSGYELVPEYNTTLLAGGMTSLIFGYTGAMVFSLIAGFHSVAAIQRADPFLALFPLIGPFLGLGAPSYRSQVDPDLLYLRDVVLLCDAAVQWLGVGLAMVGYFFPTKVLQLRDEGARAGLFLPLGPGGLPGLSLAVAFGP